MQEIDGEYFYLFNYYPGKPLKGKQITQYHCTKIGKTLAEIHNLNKTFSKKYFKETAADWDFYLTEIKKTNTQLYKILQSGYSLITEMQNKGNRAIKKLPNVISVCHNDMDSKNVLWNGRDYRIIDLECLSYNHPQMELLELALCWSGHEDC